MRTFIALFLFLGLFSCEQDNICIEDTTPHLIIRFYDKDNPSKTKAVTNLKVEVENSLDEIVQIGSAKSTDSIVLPLNVDLDLTKIHLTKNYTETSVGIEDSFNLSYTREDIYVSRSCGYKTVYHNINKHNLTNNWLENMTILTNDIENEIESQIKIFH